MPNYNITIDSRFDPYSFEDYLKPLSILQEQHNQAADAYANYLAQSAGLAEILGQNEKDKALLDYYNNYQANLNQWADDLAKNGLNRTNRQGVYKAKADYGLVEQMKKAVEKREALINEQRALQAKDNSIMFDRNAPGFSINDIMSGNSTYATVSRNAITADVQDRLKTWAKSTYLRKNPDFERKYGYIFQRIESGNKLDTIELAKLANYDGDDPVVNAMRDIVNDTVKKYSSTSSLWDKDAVERMRESAYAGLDSTLGSADWSHMQDIELAEARKRAAERVQTPSIGADYNWMDAITAKNDMDLYGFDGNQISYASVMNGVLIGSIKHEDLRTIKNINYYNNIRDFILNNYKSESGNVSEEDKVSALALINKTTGPAKVIPIELIPEGYKKEYQKAIEKRNDAYKNKKAQFEGDSIIERANQELFKKYVNNDAIEGAKSIMNKYVDYVNKGAIRTEGAFYVGADTQTIYDNIMNYLGDPETASFYKGQNLGGNFVEDLNNPGTEEFKKVLLNKEGKVRTDAASPTRIGLFTDAQNNLVAVMKNGDKAYQFNLTEARNKNFPVNKEQQKAYQTSLTALRYANTLKLAAESITKSGRDLTDEEKGMLEFLRTLTNDKTLSINDIDEDDIKNLQYIANTTGKVLYDSLFEMFAKEQKNAVTTNTGKRYNDKTTKKSSEEETEEES